MVRGKGVTCTATVDRMTVDGLSQPVLLTSGAYGDSVSRNSLQKKQKILYEIDINTVVNYSYQKHITFTCLKEQFFTSEIESLKWLPSNKCTLTGLRVQSVCLRLKRCNATSDSVHLSHL